MLSFWKLLRLASDRLSRSSSCWESRANSMRRLTAPLASCSTHTRLIGAYLQCTIRYSCGSAMSCFDWKHASGDTSCDQEHQM
jgi:hypothetical protein